MDEDLKLALQLQAQFDYEASMEQYRDRPKEPPKSPQVSTKGLSLVDPQWEMLDPSPDVRALFLEFNDKYFWGKLAGVEVRWSPRMTLCAGLCVYEGRGGLCSVRLSEPLLKLRPRKDLIETLLHEMIHAFLFVTDRNTDHDGHGPQFQSHMHRLNKLTGTNITIYHNFHDEVDNYRQHWWKCDGPCQNRKPYFGLVKRAMNRAPSPRDPWWPDHQRTCGGTYHKIKEPEGYGKKKNKEEKKKTEVPDNSKKGPDIRSLFNKGTSKNPPSTISKPGQRETDKMPNLNPVRPPDLSKTGIHTFSDFGIDLNNSDNNSDVSDRASQDSVGSVHQVVFTGQGHKLGDRGAGGVQNRRIPGLFEPTASTSSNIQPKKADTPKANITNTADSHNNISNGGFVPGNQDNKKTTSGFVNNFSDAMSSDDDWIFSQEIDNMTKTDTQDSTRTSSEATLKGSNGDIDFISLSEDESDSILSPTKTKSITPKLNKKEQGSQNLKNKVKRIRLPGMSVSNPASKRSREISDSDSENDNTRHKRAKKSNPSHSRGKSGIRSMDKTASLVGIFTDSSNDGFDEPSLITIKHPAGDGFQPSRSDTTSGNVTTGPSRTSNAAPPGGESGSRTSTDVFVPSFSSGSNLPHAQPTGAATHVPNTNSDVVDLDPWRSCPVCSTKVRESQINQHLDSCLS